MKSSRLYTLFLTDSGAWRAMNGTAFAISFTYASCAILSGTARQEWLSGAIIIAGSIVALWTLTYCFRREPPRKSNIPNQKYSLAIGRRASFAGILALISLVLAASLQRINAALLGPRLAKTFSEDAKRRNLHATADILHEARDQSLRAPNIADSLYRVKQELLALPETTPGYWNLVLSLISDGSSIIDGGSLVPPPGKPTLSISRNAGYGIHFPTVTYQIVLLDGGDLGPITFKRCRIIFTENQVRMRDVNFVNCVFEIPVIDHPNNYLRNTAMQLLASNLTAIKGS
jgi:hypothetical protein